MGRPTFSQRYTLLEILFFLGNGSVFASVFGYAIGDCFVHRTHCSQRKFAQIDAQDLQQIADSWRADNDNQCPTPRRLKDEKQMSAGASLNDPWGSPWKIFCDGGSTTVVGAGPDRDAGTADDIVFPPTP